VVEAVEHADAEQWKLRGAAEANGIAELAYRFRDRDRVAQQSRSLKRQNRRTDPPVEQQYAK
jgi:hypothetical protein